MVANAIAAGLSAISGIASMFGGSGASSAFLSESANKRLMKYQQDLDRETRRNSYQDTRYSLEQAGYNPLLAVGQQANGGSYSSAMSVQDPKTERMNNILSSLANMSQLKLNSANAYNQVMQGNLTNAQAYNLMTQSQLNSAQVGLTNLQQTAQHIQNLHLPKLLKSQILLNNNNAQALLMNAQSNQQIAAANTMNSYTNSAVGRSQVWRNYNQSLGYSSSYHVGPTGISYSHTGNSNVVSPGSTKKKGYYRTEYINGRPVQVYVVN